MRDEAEYVRPLAGFTKTDSAILPLYRLELMVALGKDGCKFNFSMLRSAHMCKPYRIGAVRITIGTAGKKEE